MQAARKKLLMSLSMDTLDALDVLYPERSPDLNDSEREVWAKAGERRLINSLRAMLSEEINSKKDALPRVLRHHGDD